MDNLFTLLFKFEHVHSLIRRKVTGCPKSFARKLNMSERSLQRLIQRMRDQGLPIGYDHHRRTYYYTGEVRFNFDLSINGEQEICIKGGKSWKTAKLWQSPTINLYSDDVV